MVTPIRPATHSLLGGQQVVRQDLEYICDRLEEEFRRLNGKRLLMTGGAGFLGFSLVQALAFWNAERGGKLSATVYDNFRFGIPGWLESLAAAGEVKVERSDVSRPLQKDIGDHEYIIHAASIASPVFYRKFPIETMDANVNGLRGFLEYFRRRKISDRPVEGFLFFSSSEIYGDPPEESIPTLETYRGNVSCTGPRACYDEAKRYGETLCVNFAQQYHLPVKIVRPFNNYGPGLRLTDGRLIPDLAGCILENRDVVLHSDGSPTRTFCYVADAVVGYYKVLVRGRTGEAYNIGVEEPEISVRQLAEKMVSLGRELFEYRGRIIHQPSSDMDYLVDNPGRRCPSIARARSELNYHPAISLEDGLRRSLVWYRDEKQSRLP